MPTILSRPNLSDLPAYLEALHEGVHSGMGPLPAQELAEIEKEAATDPKQYIEDLINGPRPTMVKQDDGSVVPMVTFRDGKTVPWQKWRITRLWLLDDGEFVGIVNIRHPLTERDKIFNGNIGYGIRPAKQGKGYGNTALNLALPFYRELTGENRALLCCYADNIRSRKVIERNGGKLYETIPDPDEPARSIHHFWADI
jgi:predicted acetyltransferase